VPALSIVICIPAGGSAARLSAYSMPAAVAITALGVVLPIAWSRLTPMAPPQVVELLGPACTVPQKAVESTHAVLVPVPPPVESE
jgi:hypothetical protein